MSSIIFSSKSAVGADTVGAGARLAKVIQELAAVNSYDHEAAFLHTPHDAQVHSSIKALIASNRYQEIDTVLLVGIGGSNLAVKAVSSLLQHTESNTSKKTILFAETVDPEYTQALYQKIEGMLVAGKKVLLVIATKSGTTTETIALASLFIECFKRHYKTEHHNYIVTITDDNSPLYIYARAHNYRLLTVPVRVGGRYSAFSVVGLFPLALLGYDIDAFCQGARKAQDEAWNLKLPSGGDIFGYNNAIIQSALIAYHYYQSSMRIHNMFLFSADAAGLGAWYRQLTAESLGKIRKHTQSGPQMSDNEFGNKSGPRSSDSEIGYGVDAVGILPIVSIGSTDLHSMVQLYFANPIPILTTFVTFGSDILLSVPDIQGLSKENASIMGKSLSSILRAIETGTINAYEQAGLPFMHMHLHDKSEYAIGEFMQWKMIETVLLARLLEINPFDQPEVERYKQQTRKILAHE